jgi:hypothetical protein
MFTLSTLRDKVRDDTMICAIVVGFGVLTAVIMKSSIFWDITSCSPLKVNARFGGTFRVCLQGQRFNQARNQHDVGSKLTIASCSAYFSTLKMEKI